ncbi:hypothetical protein RNN91_00425 [Mycoplasmopsis felis]|uniref:MGA_1079 family surface serine endopeptidase n=1 Tax=Mycoplasmopsis felis TaxID=33923 RepID=UPI002AF6CC45|nr:hypothetical protein [Mycoplasmopsis felis]WQQ02065.1 hypothetical protein RRG54_01770 [Mycoplasmopsis felis]
MKNKKKIIIGSSVAGGSILGAIIIGSSVGSYVSNKNYYNDKTNQNKQNETLKELLSDLHKNPHYTQVIDAVLLEFESKPYKNALEKGNNLDEIYKVFSELKKTDDTDFEKLNDFFPSSISKPNTIDVITKIYNKGQGNNSIIQALLEPEVSQELTEVKNEITKISNENKLINQKTENLIQLFNLHNFTVNDLYINIKNNFKQFLEIELNTNLTEELIQEYENNLSKSNNILKRLNIDNENNVSVVIDNIVNNLSIQEENKQTLKENLFLVLSSFYKLNETIRDKEIKVLNNELKAKLNEFNVILSQNEQINSFVLVPYIKQLQQKIETYKSIDENKYNELINQLQNINNFDLFNELQNQVDALLNNFRNQKEDLKNVLANTKISVEFKNNKLKEITELKTLSNVNEYKNQLNLINQKTNQIVNKIKDIKNLINNKSISGQSEYDFYELLGSNLNVYNNLNDELKTIDSNILDTFYNSLNSLNISTSNNQSLQEIFVQKTTEYFNTIKTQLKNNYNTTGITEGNDGFLSVGSINYNNAKILLKELDNNSFDFEISKLTLDDSKKSLIITYQITSKFNPNLKTELQTTIDYGTDNNQVVEKFNSLNEYNNADSLIDINYFELSKLTYQEFQNKFDLNKTNQTYKTLGIFANVINKENGEIEYETEKSNLFFKKSKYIKSYFTYQLKETPTFENNKLNFKIDIYFNDQVLKTLSLSSQNNVNFQTSTEQSLDDAIDKQKIIEILNAGRNGLYENWSVKRGIKKTHTDYYVKDAIKALNDIYIMPKHGRYEIKPYEVVEARYIESSQWGGLAKVFFWYQEDGQWAELPSDRNKYTYNIDHFKHVRYDDYVEPKNGLKLTEADFVGFQRIDDNLINQVNTLNSADFTFRKAAGKAENNSNTTAYRVFNPSAVLEQNAELKINYIFRLLKNNQKQNNNTPHVADKNYDNDWYVPLNVGHLLNNVDNPSDIQWSSANNDTIENRLFYYFYDVKLKGKRGISYKLGFIDKKDSNKRYTNPNKIFYAYNLVNDYEQVLYPNIILNNIKLSDLKINTELLKNKKASYFKNNLNELNEIITLKQEDEFISYKNYEIPKNRFSIIDITKGNENYAFVRFGFKDNNDNIVKGHNWYRISGFDSDESILEFRNLDHGTDLLKTTYLSTNEVFRSRILEPYWKDLLWNKDSDYQASWTLKKQYLEHTFLKPNTRNRTIDFSFFITPLIFDNNKDNRQKQERYAIKYKLDFEKLFVEKLISWESNFEFTDNNQKITIPYRFIFKWDDIKGLTIEFLSLDSTYKLLIDISTQQQRKENKTFDNDRAIIVSPASAKMIINYVNETEDEGTFGLNYETNLYDYNKVDFGQPQEPMILYNDGKILGDYSFYNPNQNVPWKHNQGYKPDRQWIRTEWGVDDNWTLIKNVKKRAIRYTTGSLGSGSLIGKVSDDPTDYRFYILTNHHVESRINNLSDFNANNLVKDLGGGVGMRLPLNIYKNEIHEGNPYTNYGGADEHHVTATWIRGAKAIWTGHTGTDFKTRTGETGSEIDATITVVDLKESLKQANLRAKGDMIRFIDDIYNSENVKFDISYSASQIWVPALKDIAHTGFPGWGGLTGYVNHRPEVGVSETVIRQFPNYSPMKFGGGNSGTSFFIGDDSLISLWRAGANGAWSTGTHMETERISYMGVNHNNENPLELKNSGSFGNVLFKASLKNPGEFSMPWFYKPILNNK